MSEEMKMDAERARVVDAMCMTWRHDFGLDKREHKLGSCGMTDEERDALRRQMCQLYDHHFAQARAGLPVGVPDGWKLVPLKFIQSFSALAHQYSLGAVPPDYYEGMAGDAFRNAYARCGRDLAVLRAMLAAAPSAPAGEAENFSTTSDRYRAELYDEVWQKARDMGYSNVTEALTDLDRAKPAGEAVPVDGVEAPEVVAWMWRDLNGDMQFNYMHPEGQELMTVAQHNRIVAALSAQQSAPERVSVPEGWRIVEKPTCFALLDGNQVVATLAGPEAEDNAAIIAAVIASHGRPTAATEEGEV